MGPRFFLTTLPTTVAMVFSTGVAFLVGHRLNGVEAMAIAAALGLLSLMGAWTFRGAAWAPALHLGFSAAVGLLVARLPAANEALFVRASVALALAGVLAGALVGRGLRRFLGGAYATIWIGACLVVLVMVGLELAGSPTEWTRAAATAAVVVFAVLAAAWFARLGEAPPTLASLDLYLIGLAVFLAGAVMLRPTA